MIQTVDDDRSTTEIAGNCRSCSRAALKPIISLGKTPLANSFLTRDQLAQPQERYPLDLAFCTSCSLVQLTVTVPPEKLYSEYFYTSSYSETFLKHSEDIATHITKSRNLGPDSLILEIGSNDGYLLQYYKRLNIPVTGIEPAKNVARVAEERGIPTRCEFFGLEFAGKLSREGTRADVIHANNVLAHIPELNGTVAGISKVLKESGVAVIEVPYVKDMVDQLEFDTIYHEHLCYFSLTALDRLFRRHGLVICDVQRLAIHGGTLRLFAMKKAGEPGEISEAVRALLAEEIKCGLNTFRFYEDFAERVARLREHLVSTLRELKSKGKSIAVYGASAKGSTLLNHLGIGAEILDFVVDRSTLKQGHFMPGTHLQISAPERLLEEMPDYVLLLTWNISEEVLEQQHEYRTRGGRFIIPIPEVTVIDPPSQAVHVN